MKKLNICFSFVLIFCMTITAFAQDLTLPDGTVLSQSQFTRWSELFVKSDFKTIADETLKAIKKNPNDAVAIAFLGKVRVYVHSQVLKRKFDFDYPFDSRYGWEKLKWNGLDYNEKHLLGMQTNCIHLTPDVRGFRELAWELSSCKAAIKFLPNSALLYFFMGLGLEDKEAALGHLTKSIELNPKFAVAYMERAKIYAKFSKDIQRVISDYTKAIEAVDTKYAALYYYGRGRAYLDSGDADRAIADFNKAIKIDPDHPCPYFGRSMFYQKKGDKARWQADIDKGYRCDDDLDDHDDW